MTTVMTSIDFDNFSFINKNSFGNARVNNIIYIIWAGGNIHNFASENDEYYCSSQRLEILYNVSL